MTETEAITILSENKLTSFFDGLDDFPCERVLIEEFNFCEDEDMWARLYAFVSKRDKDDVRKFGHYACESFVVHIPGTGYYFRGIFPEAMAVVRAARIVNKYHYISDYYEDGTECKD